MSNKAAAGAGSIRKKTIIKNGKEHTYWEARYTLGRDPVHTAVSSGSWCGGQRQQCGDSGSGLR